VAPIFFVPPAGPLSTGVGDPEACDGGQSGFIPGVAWAATNVVLAMRAVRIIAARIVSSGARGIGITTK
jgi:hypothetical protein